MNCACIVSCLIFMAGLVSFGEQEDAIEAILKAPASSMFTEMNEGLKVPKLTSDFPGDTTRVVDPYGTNAPNPLFLTSLPGKLWWSDQAEERLPILVTEPVGLLRLSQPVSLMHRFPAGTLPESIRVVTPYGCELPSQVRVVNGDESLFEVMFVLNRFDAAAQVPLFVYYGRKAISVPRPAAPFSNRAGRTSGPPCPLFSPVTASA